MTPKNTRLKANTGVYVKTETYPGKEYNQKNEEQKRVYSKRHADQSLAGTVQEKPQCKHIYPWTSRASIFSCFQSSRVLLLDALAF